MSYIENVFKEDFNQKVNIFNLERLNRSALGYIVGCSIYVRKK